MVSPTKKRTKNFSFKWCQNLFIYSKKGFLKLRERIELDKTLSKYRSEIHDILAPSEARKRAFQNLQSTVNDNCLTKHEPSEDVIYTGQVDAYSGEPSSGVNTRSPQRKDKHQNNNPVIYEVFYLDQRIRSFSFYSILFYLFVFLRILEVKSAWLIWRQKSKT